MPTIKLNPNQKYTTITLTDDATSYAIGIEHLTIGTNIDTSIQIMAYKGRRVKKKPIYKKPAFWIAILAVVLILLLVGWVWKTLSNEVFTIRKPDETTLPTSQEKPEETPGSDFYIVLSYSDGSQKLYRQHADRYMQKDGVWKCIDPKKALELSRILGKMESDPV